MLATTIFFQPEKKQKTSLHMVVYIVGKNKQMPKDYTKIHLALDVYFSSTLRSEIVIDSRT